MSDKPHAWNIFAITFSALMALVTLGVQRCDVARQKKEAQQQQAAFAEEQIKHNKEVAEQKEQNRKAMEIAARSAAAAEASATATKRSIDLAKRSLDVSESSLEMDQRPWLYPVESVYEPQDLHLTDHPEHRFDTIVMTFKNYGKTPAFSPKVRAYVVSDERSYLRLSPWDPLESTLLSFPNVIPPGGDIRIQLDPDFRAQNAGVNPERVGYEVEIRYMDIFRHQRQTLSCTGYDPIGHKTYPCLAHVAELAEFK